MKINGVLGYLFWECRKYIWMCVTSCSFSFARTQTQQSVYQGSLTDWSLLYRLQNKVENWSQASALEGTGLGRCSRACSVNSLHGILTNEIKCTNQGFLLITPSENASEWPLLKEPHIMRLKICPWLFNNVECVLFFLFTCIFRGIISIFMGTLVWKVSQILSVWATVN